MRDENLDNIERILKSISPLKNTFSKMSKKLNKTFKYASLENLVKSLDVKYVYKDQFEPDEEVIIHKNDYNLNFQNSYDYLEELSDINNLPLVAQNRNCIKDGDFNPDYDVDINKSEINKKYLKEEEGRRKKERLKKRIELLKKYKENDSKIDPGKYHPNYDVIKRRYPCAYIRDPNVHIKDSWLVNCPFRNTFEEYKRKQNEENEQKENSKNNSKNNSPKKDNNTNTNFNQSQNQNQGQNNNNNNNSSNNNNNAINNQNKNDLTNNANKISSFNSGENSPRSLSTNEIIKEKSEEDSISIREKKPKLNSIIQEKTKKLNLPMIINSPRNKNSSNISNISKVFSPKRKVNRSISYENLLSKKSPILFKKMKGREDIFTKTKYLISYNINYECTFPHIPSVMFKYIKNKQNYKKYINGKLIRGYYYNPSDYYVMELKRAEEKK